MFNISVKIVSIEGVFDAVFVDVDPVIDEVAWKRLELSFMIFNKNRTPKTTNDRRWRRRKSDDAIMGRNDLAMQSNGCQCSLVYGKLLRFCFAKAQQQQQQEERV